MNKKVLIPVGIGVGVALLGLAVTSKKASPVLISDTATGADQTAPPSPVIDVNKMLAKGSNGLEVKELQRLMSITADGVFGSQTESRLFSLKGVKSTSLSRFKTLPNINQNIYPIGSKVMANISFGTSTKLYQAIKKADGTYVGTDFIGTTITYGEEIGSVIGVNGTGSWYLIYRDSFWNGGHYFVRATEIKKI